MLVVGAALAVLCIFFRYVIGATLIDTGGSLLVVGVLHASSDASGAAFGTGWQQMIGGVVIAVHYRAGTRNRLTLLVRAARPRRRPSSTRQPTEHPDGSLP